MKAPSWLVVLISITAASGPSSSTDSAAVPPDLSTIRGANYCAAGGHHLEHWLRYDPKETERDLDYAKRIGINQVRVFLGYAAYLTNKETFRNNLIHLARACD